MDFDGVSLSGMVALNIRFGGSKRAGIIIFEYLLVICGRKAIRKDIIFAEKLGLDFEER